MAVLVKIGIALFWSVMYLAPLLFIGWGLYSLVHSRHSRVWPTTPGRVLESRLALTESADSGPLWTVHVRYSYAVSGEFREGTRIAYGYTGGDEVFQRRLFDKLSHAQVLAVRYNPHNPAQAVLGHSEVNSRMLILFGAMFGVFPLAMTTMALSSRLDDGRYDSLLGVSLAALFLALLFAAIHLHRKWKDGLVHTIEVLANKAL